MSDSLSSYTSTWSAVFDALTPQLTVVWAQPKMRYGLILLAAAVVVMFVWRPGNPGQTKTQPQQKVHVRRHTATPWTDRLGAWLHPPQVPWAIGHIVTTARWLPHAIVLGAPGSGKSMTVAGRILGEPLGVPGLIWKLRGRPLRKRRGMLIVTGNYSAPFRASVLTLLEQGYHALIWTPDGGWGLDVLEGPADSAAKRVMAMHTLAVGDTGLRRGAVEALLQEALELLDERGSPRSFEAVLSVMPEVRQAAEKRGELTQNTRNGLDDWTTRLRTLKRTFGGSIGSDVRLSEALAQGWTVLIELSSYKDPTQTEALARFFVEYAKYLVASQGHFDLVLDEVGAVDPKTYSELLSATRAPEVRITMCGQSPSQFEDSMREMCSSVLLLGIAAAAPEARRWASQVVDGDVSPEDFILLSPPRWFERLMFWRRRQGLRSLEGYLLSSSGHLDRVRTRPMNLRILTRWPKGSIPQLVVDNGVVNSGSRSRTANAGEPVDLPCSDGAGKPRVVVVEIPRAPLALPAPTPTVAPAYIRHDPDRLRIWQQLSNTAYDGGCWIWQGGLNGKGYGITHYQGVRALTHHLLWCWATATPLEELRRKVRHENATLDHACPGSDRPDTRCCQPAHLELVKRSINSRLRWERVRARVGHTRRSL